MRSRRTGRVFAGVLAGTLLLGMLAGCGAPGEKMAASDMAWNGGAATQSVSAEAMNSEVYDGMWTDGAAAEDYYEGEKGYDSLAGDSSAAKKANRDTSDTKRKLIRTVNMNVETQEYDALMTSLENRIEELGGYIENLESYNGSSYSGQVRRSATMTIRIPQADLSDFVSSISDLANIVRRTESVEDITLTYVDLKSHKESLQVEQERLLELLERADTLEDIITLENRLTSIRYQIESMESQLRTYDDKVDYSTVNLRIDEVQVYTPIKEDDPTPWERMVDGLKESLEDIRDGVMNFGIWVVVNSPYLVIWGVVIAVVVVIIRKKRKKIRAAKAEKKALKEQGKDSGKPAGSTSGEAPENAGFFDNTSENR